MQSRKTALVALAIWACAVIYSSQAQDFPSRPLRMVVPTAPGGLTDMPARLLAERMRNHLNQQAIVVDNRSGAGGIIGAEIVKQATPNGYTLLYGQAPVIAYLPALARKLPYRVLEDFVPVMLSVRSPLGLVVRADGVYRSVMDLVKAAHGRPGGLNYGTAGSGTASHLVGLMLAGEAKIPLTAIHNRGDAPALQDLLSGQVDFYTAGAVRPLVDSGKLRILAVTGTTRWFVFPDTLTFKELGFSGVEIYAFSGILAPKGTPAATVQRVNRAANEALKDPTVRERLMAVGFELGGGTPEDFRRFLATEIERYRRVGAQSNLVLD